ncbi:ferritin-like domain-containing protein [Kriegella aquimaris]|uniref:DUF2383 domain-containing protein n=1 Tax=Kriegella aquimaris TaxID=192904 RepID=A0A1G9J9G4_9FLAO|nr:PA2169 family four-helix-bundle protein [Kriegella aquimaris]SDL34200.1 conserved hypothetical protein [Kriegella aquimaris]
MGTYTKELADRLNGILEKNSDAEKGFGNAANNTENRILSAYFNEKALQRRAFAEELKSEIVTLGKDFDESGSATAAAHRAWIDIKSFFGNSDEAMLQESIRGERAAVEEYEEVLREISLPTTTAIILRNQMLKIESGLALIKNIKDLEERSKAL